MSKRSVMIMGLVVILGAAVVCVFTVPFTYAERPIWQDRVDYVVSLQQARPAMGPAEVATAYCFYRTDYQDSLPARIRVTEKRLVAEVSRVTIYDPACRDDSVYSTRNRIYLRLDGLGCWQPFKAEWSHKGRGRIGWTTKPTK